MIIFPESAKKCTGFVGPENKNEFKNEMLEVLRVTKQRYRNHVKKAKSKLPDIDEDETDSLQEQIIEENSSDHSSNDGDIDEED